MKDKGNGMLCLSEKPLVKRNSTQIAALKETNGVMLPQNILNIRCPRLAKNTFAIQHL